MVETLDRSWRWWCSRSPWPLGSLAVLAVAVGLGGPLQAAAAQDRSRPHVVTRDGPAEGPGVTRVPVDRDRPEGAQVIRREVAESAAVVSRALSEQPVLPHLVEVQLGGVTVLVDPKVNYRRPTGGLDANHTIRRAQRLHEAAQPTLPARVLRNPRAGLEPAQPQQRPVPRAIFRLPVPPPDNEVPTLPEVQDRHDGSGSPVPYIRTAPAGEADLIVIGD